MEPRSVTTADVDVNVCADVDDGVILVANMATVGHLLNRLYPKICYPAHDVVDPLDLLYLLKKII